MLKSIVYHSETIKKHQIRPHVTSCKLRSGHSEGLLDISVDCSSFIIENNYKVVTENKQLDNVDTMKYDIGLYNTK